MNYIQVSFTLTDSSFTEIIEAELIDTPAESFDFNENQVIAFFPENEFQQADINRVSEAYSDVISKVEKQTIEHKNWNEVWESNYEPIQLDNELFIGAPFHTVPSSVRHAMTIDPNMSFGTGHHPTTELVIRSMMDMELKNKRLLDFGCGSGILSIYADFKGGSGIAIEIDAHAAEAARKNLQINKCSSFDILTGGIEALDGSEYDIILANINRNVIIECLPIFMSSLKKGGQFICSGFLVEDAEDVSNRLFSAGLENVEVNSKGTWACITAIKT